MASQATLDFESLLAPISEQAPSGESLREHPELSRDFYAVREARNSAMDAERVMARLSLMDESDFDQDPTGQDTREIPDWHKVVELASVLLARQTKDLWIVSWLIEAQTRVAGIAGFRDGLRLCREMSEKFWDTIHPRPDEDDGYGHTVAQLAGLDNTLPDALMQTRILPDAPEVTWSNYELSLELEDADPEERSARIERGAISLATIESAIRTADREELLRMRLALTQAVEECGKFAESLDARCGKDESGYPLGPSTSNLVRVLERLTGHFDELTRGLLDDTAAEQVSEQAMTAASENGEVNLMQRPVASRDEALQHLLRVADFFRKTEPHSPVSYALEQAVRWGRMPLPDLLKDLVSDQSVLGEVFKRMGIAESDQSAGSDEEYS